ncbi:nucleotide exchange factor GrpE [Acidipropionibacterium jensenii]|uniref:nucleotide exchange factor GrpE n=1 Tax=Acidipropionibacterium jensenii TaxID=1749 RepID=UPI000BC30BD9|nr:nucleotide exchange factor GrpE [Acidipropionibacterium jensenii]AZZ41467.1 nucleotide exchange factor GrpE [Acidipropionibacterium jensenii]
MSDNENFDKPEDADRRDGGDSPADPADRATGRASDDQAFNDIVEGVELSTGSGSEGPADPPSRESQLATLLAERTEDLQRLQAEYVNYKRRVDRDRDLARQVGVRKVVADLMPVLDSIEMARQHGELEEGSGFRAVADALAKVAAAHDLTSFGAVGEEFDPHVHEALMQVPLPGATVTSVSQVMQPGYKLGDQVLRPARVAVSDPDPNAVSDGTGSTGTGSTGSGASEADGGSGQGPAGDN